MAFPSRLVLYIITIFWGIDKSCAFLPSNVVSSLSTIRKPNEKQTRQRTVNLQDKTKSSAHPDDVSHSSAPSEYSASTLELLSQFAADMSRLSELRPPVPSADFSIPPAIVSAGSSYTRIWSHETWRKHSLSAPHIRYFRHIWRWRFSTTAQKVAPCSLLAALWAALVSLVVMQQRHNTLLKASLQGASAALSALTAPLALLLTLRTNQSLGRLNETRVAWGRLVLITRRMSSQLRTYVLDSHPQACLLAARYLAMYGWCLKAAMRGEDDDSLRPVLQTLLPLQYEWLSHHPRPVWGIVARLRQLMRDVFFSPPVGPSSPECWVAHSKLEDSMEQLEGIAGACERILASPIPPTYCRHLSRVMVLWLLALPLGLAGAGVHSVGTILTTAFLSYVMVGLDEIGMEIENPFFLLPLQQLAGAAQQGVAMQLLLDQECFK